MRYALMLRGINLGPNRRVPMAELRALLGDAGFGDVQTYVQSGNVVLDSELDADALEAETGRLISKRFGFDVPVLARSGPELAAVVAHDPLGDVATNPKRYQVTFLGGEPDGDVVARLERLAAPSERFVVHGREVYAWHPEGVARSKLWPALAGKGLGVAATARNWTTVTVLAQMTSEQG